MKSLNKSVCLCVCVGRGFHLGGVMLRCKIHEGGGLRPRCKMHRGGGIMSTQQNSFGGRRL